MPNIYTLLSSKTLFRRLLLTNLSTPATGDCVRTRKNAITCGYPRENNRGYKKIKSVLVFAVNAVYFKKNEDISLFYLPSPLGKVSTELTKEVIKKDLSKFIKKVRPLSS